MAQEKQFTVNEKYIKLEGITSNPDVFCQIDTEALMAGQRIFPCSVNNVSYQLSTQDAKLAMYMSAVSNTKIAGKTQHL